MKLRPPFLASDKDTFLQRRRGKWAKLPHRQEGRRSFRAGRLGSPLPHCVASARFDTTPSLSFCISKMGVIIITLLYNETVVGLNVETCTKS